MSFLYSMEPRRSAPGLAAAAARRPASAKAASSAFLPARYASAAVTLIGVGPTFVRPIPARSMTPPFRTRTALAVAKSPSLELDVGPAAARGRGGDADLRQHLRGLKGGREEAGEELRDRDRPRALRPRGHHLRPQGEHGGGVIIGGVAVGQVAAHGGQVAHDRVGDDGCGVGEDRIAGPHDIRGPSAASAPRAPIQGRRPLCVVEAGDARYPPGARAGEAQLEQRQQALSSGKDLGLVPELPEKRQPGEVLGAW